MAKQKVVAQIREPMSLRAKKDKTRQDKTRQDTTRHDTKEKTRQGKATQDKTRQDNTRYDESIKFQNANWGATYYHKASTMWGPAKLQVRNRIEPNASVMCRALSYLV